MLFILVKAKKGQIWYTDFIVALLLFMIALTIYFSITNSLLESGQGLDEMITDLNVIGSSLISEGFPRDWNASTVEKIGFTNGNYRLNQTKLERLYAMDHEPIRLAFNTRFNLYIFLLDQNDNPLLINGEDSVGLNSTNAEQLIRASRILIYNSTIVKLVVHLWI